ncbi:unnamed protein product [Zymoseptoria tritici ST99CH_1E4]|uniref:Uncharacterized protein n=1 Tax=Zymoseptoria tritici ST99CH_1E4 TaxID=1276532 RepID=A0A2H1H9Q1_ZYMTR|nr:unnamed protein product [Zymoseptoria tritici ST99CH_1E4]
MCRPNVPPELLQRPNCFNDHLRRTDLVRVLLFRLTLLVEEERLVGVESMLSTLRTTTWLWGCLGARGRTGMVVNGKAGK